MKKTITKCLFPAAGYGTRFLPATKAMPKEMLPVLNKPLIQYGVEEALDAGCHCMAIVTGRGKRAIEDHFDISYELEHQIQGTDKEAYLKDVRSIMESCTFSYTRQKEMLGLGHAILTGETLVGNEPFAVILADEATGNLDTRTSFEILVLFQKLHAEGRTIIFVTHNPEIAQYSSRNIVLRDGQIKDDCLNENILDAAKALAALPVPQDD